MRDRKLDMVLARALDAFDPREVADRRLRAAGYECELCQQTLHRSGDRTSRASEMAKAAKPLRAWCISVIGAKSRYIGRIEAPDEETAIAKTAEEFRIDPTRRFRLVLTV